MVGADFTGPDPKVGTVTELVQIEQQLFGRALAVGTPAEQGILLARLEPAVVEPGPELLGHRAVAFLSSADQLAKELLLQLLGMAHCKRGVLVLRLEIAEHGRIVTDLEPVELVLAEVAMVPLHPGDLLGARWLGKRERSGRCEGAALACRQTQGGSGAGRQAA